MRTPSLAGRFAAAIALLIGFYLLALLIIAACLAIAILPWAVGGHGNLWFTIGGLALGWSILTTLVPRRIKFDAPGAELARDAQPRLHALIAEEVAKAGERAPDEVYLTLQVNAAVTQLRGRRILEVGLPLMEVLSERELRGVIAHELGHYAGGDTRLGPWIYRTRETIGRTIARLSSESHRWSRRLARVPFLWYGNAFLRVTNAISRRQEFAADALAARSAGSGAYASALRKVHAGGAAFDGYWMNEVVPVLNARRRPPIAAGFRHFRADDAVAEAAREHLERELAEGTTSPYDSHPSLPERLAAIEALPPGEPDESPAAIALLDGAERLEARALDVLLGADAMNFRNVSWEAVGRDIYVERARELVTGNPELVRDVTVGGVPEAVERLPRTVERLAKPGDDPERVAAFVAMTLADGVLLALATDGWEIDAPPASPIVARRGDASLIPHLAIGELRGGELSADEWRERCEAVGIADLPLSGISAARAAA